MKNSANRISVIILAAVFTLSSLSALSACARTDNPVSDDVLSSTEESAPAETTTEEELQPELPERDYCGADFTFLVRYDPSIHYAPWEARDIYSEEQTGEPINDAVYVRNRFVEEKYNVRIKEIKDASYNTMLRKAVLSGDPSYDVFYANLNDITGVISNGFFRDLNTVPYLDFSKPWWDGNAVSSLSIGGRLYLATSDLIVMDNDCTSAIVFNKKLIQDFALDDPYQLVRTKKWTTDKVIEMSKDISRDINGDGVMDYNDMYGYVCYRDSSLSLMHASGGRIARKDESDLPILTLGEEKSFDALSKAFDLMYAPSAFNVHKELEGKFDAIYPVTEKMFMEDRSLFYWILLHDIEQFRNMDSEFGILPIPLYSSEQEGYQCTVNQYHGHAFTVPVSNPDPERAGIILEALSAKSMYTLQPAYYDVSLKRKFTRDEQSAEMLDIIFASRVYDIGAIYNFGGYSWDIIAMTMTQNRDIVSLYERNAAKAQKDIDRLVEKLKGME